jgi:citrate/tricarballylate utilization protein
VPHNSESDAQRVMGICNACRYCEGYCAVFPAMELSSLQAMEQRSTQAPDRIAAISLADLNYLANLCHNCAECYYACPYTPPHEFAVNVPKLFAEIRAQSYRECARPQWYGGAIIPALALCLLVFLWGAWAESGSNAGPTADFYSVISHSTMIAIFGSAAGLVFVMLIAGVARFWRKSGSTGISSGELRPVFKALRDAMTLKYLASGEAGCANPDRQDSYARRWFHHFTFYGFLLALASTISAAVDHYLLGLSAPYPFLSVPVILGTLGGIGLLIGPAGLYSLKRRRDVAISDPHQNGADVSFLALLFFTSLTGLLLLALRDTPEMGILLRVHLGVVLALFLTMPYGKFVHGGYRLAALVRYAFETASSETRKVR